MQRRVLTRLPDQPLRVFVVWVPMVRRDAEAAVPAATRAVPDPRAHHFWDGRRELARAYASILRLRYDLATFDRALIFRWMLRVRELLRGESDLQHAWDVYLLFDRQARWDELPPAPHFWQHQLRISPINRRDGAELEAAVRRQLAVP